MNQDKLAFYTDEARLTAYENKKRLESSDIVPEGFCTTCKGFTTNYNSRGECNSCGTELVVDISEEEI